MKLVIADSKMKAGDNGEYFYDYVMENHPKDELYFIISKESSDFNRLKNKGFNVIDVDDNRLSKIFDDADYILYSKEQKPISTPMCRKHSDKRVFLQHGVTTRMSLSPNSWVKHNRYTRYICSISKGEKRLLTNLLGVSKNKPIITGFARWDSLQRKNNERESHEKPHIMITFHWRSGEMNKDVDVFKSSTYLKNINELLNSKELKELSKLCDITFMHHAQFAKYKEYFKVPSYIKYGTNLQFQDMLVDADALITDISSNAYEMAVINKPTFYYIPDIRYVKRHMTTYKIDELKENSIGKYCNDINELIETIRLFVNGKFELSELNKKNIKETLGSVDSNNCKRLYDFLLKDLDKRKKEKDTNSDDKKKVVHTGGIWTVRRKILSLVDSENIRGVKAGNKIVYV